MEDLQLLRSILTHRRLQPSASIDPRFAAVLDRGVRKKAASCSWSVWLAEACWQRLCANNTVVGFWRRSPRAGSIGTKGCSQRRGSCRQVSAAIRQVTSQPKAATPTAVTKRRKAVPSATATTESPVAELQTLPGLDEPPSSTSALRPIIDAPDFKERGSESTEKPKPAADKPAGSNDKAAAREESQKTAPPMPDLTDLLPDAKVR